MSSSRGSGEITGALDVFDGRRLRQLQQPRHDSGGGGGLKSQPIPIPNVPSITSGGERERGWTCSHEVAQQSMNEMDMRMSRSRDLRMSLSGSRSHSNHTDSPFSAGTTTSFSTAATGREAVVGRTVSLATPDDDADHHPHWQQQQQQQQSAGLAFGGSGYGEYRGSVYSGSPPSEHRNRSYGRQQPQHQHQNYAFNNLLGGGGSVHRASSSFFSSSGQRPPQQQQNRRRSFS
ncbi:unnamed protein product, partial [Ectocarpus sp. 12 AP-2014]